MTSASSSGYVVALAGLARLAVCLARRVLWLLMYAGHLASSFLLRQMEYDADCYEARLVGAETFAQTFWRIHEMALAQNGAYADLRSSWQERRMPDNFPKLVLANVPQIPKEVLVSYRADVAKASTGLFDTHPCDKDRIARAQAAAPAEGVFHLDGPATDVFGNFDALAQAASLDMYRSLVGPEITQHQLFAVSELVASQTVVQEGYAASERFEGSDAAGRRLGPRPGPEPAPPAR
jgi:hypothetical protein